MRELQCLSVKCCHCGTKGKAFPTFPNSEIWEASLACGQKISCYGKPFSYYAFHQIGGCTCTDKVKDNHTKSFTNYLTE